MVLDVIARRGMNPQTSDVHCGFDGGQGMLKLGVTITDRQELDESGRAHYSQVDTFSLMASFHLHYGFISGGRS